jgi:cytochrome c oxidase cbb3-type subunit IV
MDVNDVRNLVTLLSFVIFAGIVTWAVSPRNRARFDEAQQLPFSGEEPAATPPEARDE